MGSGARFAKGHSICKIRPESPGERLKRAPVGSATRYGELVHVAGS